MRNVLRAILILRKRSRGRDIRRRLLYADLRRRFVNDGILGGNRKWLIFGGIVVGGHQLWRAVSTSVVEPVYVEDLLPGEKLMITHATRPQKRRR